MKADPMFDAASRRAPPAELDHDRGRITPGKGSAIFTVLGSGALAAIAFLSATAWAKWVGGVLLLPGLFMLPSLTRWHDVCWDGFGIQGTSRMFGPTLGWARAKIAWREIVRVGKTMTGYWYVEAEDGRRVYWSYLYLGYPVLVARLKQACPDLDLDAAEGLE
ncbi:hypothetical protein ACCC88_19470 [Sphingomonas sp. Sphisp140]|uniref:hypothetical protein n=1 Tax=unclassified Sphingomonas TaxID=196159 RepID=UPI0039AFD927